MKNVFIIFLTITCNIVLSQEHSSALAIPGRESSDGRHSLLASRSPGDIPILDSRQEKNLNEESTSILSYQRKMNEMQKWKTLKETSDFISSEAMLILHEINKEEFLGQCPLGDFKFDLVLTTYLAKTKIKRCFKNQEPIPAQLPGETSTTYKIRRNPEMTNKVDKSIFKHALLLNEVARVSQ